MALAEDFVYLFSAVGASFALDFHAIGSSLGTLHVEVYLTVMAITLYYCSGLDSFFSANDASNIEFRIVKPRHFYGCSWSHLRPRHPHRAAVMDPVVKGISARSVSSLEHRLVASQEL